MLILKFKCVPLLFVKNIVKYLSKKTEQNKNKTLFFIDNDVSPNVTRKQTQTWTSDTHYVNKTLLEDGNSKEYDEASCSRADLLLEF